MAQVFDPSFQDASMDRPRAKPRAIDLRLDEASGLGKSRGEELLKGIRSVSTLVENTSKAMQDIPSALNFDVDNLREELDRAAMITEQILDPDRDTTEQSAVELISLLENIDGFFKDNPKIDVGDTTLRSILRSFEDQNEVTTLAGRSMRESIGEAFGKGSDFAVAIASNIDELSRNRLVEGVGETAVTGIAESFLGPFGIVVGKLAEERDSVVDLARKVGETVGGVKDFVLRRNRSDVDSDEALEASIDDLQDATEFNTEAVMENQWDVAEFLAEGYRLGADMTVQELQENHRKLSKQDDKLEKAVDEVREVLDDRLEDVHDEQQKTNRRLLLQTIMRSILGMIGRGGLLAGLGLGAKVLGDRLATGIDSWLSDLTGTETSLGSFLFDQNERASMAIGDAVDEAIAFRDRMTTAMLDGIDSFVAAIKEKWASLINTISMSIETMITWIQEIPDRVIQAMSDSIDAALDKFGLGGRPEDNLDAGRTRADGSVVQPNDPDAASNVPLFQSDPNAADTARRRRIRQRELESQDPTVLRDPPSPDKPMTPDQIQEAVKKGVREGMPAPASGAAAGQTVTPGGLPSGPDDNGLNLANAGQM